MSGWWRSSYRVTHLYVYYDFVIGSAIPRLPGTITSVAKGLPGWQSSLNGTCLIMKQEKGAFIVWRKFQRRVEVLAPYLDLEIWYFYYPWEDQTKLLKALSYIPKSISTLRRLFQKRPALVFVQFPPPPALYCVALYAWLTGSRYVSDCHMGLPNAGWLKWLGTKELLRKGLILVHNEHVVEQTIRSLDRAPIVIRDGIARKSSMRPGRGTLLEDLGLSPKTYVIVPWSFTFDEPLKELIDAAKRLPEIVFVMTWHSERIPKATRTGLPSNLRLTGYLCVDDFNDIFANAGVALVLTVQEATQLSGMQEAMAFEIPAVVSDLKTTRFLYRRYPVYVENDSNSIVQGIRYAFGNRLALVERMRTLRIETEEEFSVQLAALKSSLQLPD